MLHVFSPIRSIMQFTFLWALSAGLLLSGCMVKINSLNVAGSGNSTATSGSGGLGSASGNAVYYQNQDVTYSVALSDTATVSGTPRIPITVGGVTRYANYSSGSGTSKLTFVYQPQSGDFDSAGATTSAAIDLNGGSIARTSDSQDLSTSAVITPPAAKILVDAVPHSVALNQTTDFESVPESAGSRSLTLTLSPASLGDIKIPLKRAGTAVAGVDDDLTASEVTIPAGATSVTVPYSIIPSGADQADRNLFVRLQRPSAGENFALSAIDQHNLVIRDENPAATIATLSSGAQTSCMILNGTGALKCWGINTYGQLGDGTTINRGLPTLIDSGTSYAQIGTGYRFSCGLVSGTGELKCWGNNANGELGDTTSINKSVPTAIDVGTSYAQLSTKATSIHSCGIVSGTGVLKCWGYNLFNQLGDGTITTRRSPIVINAGTSYAQVSVGGAHTCGIVSGTGALKCWGRNDSNQLGDGTTTQRSTPTSIDAGTSYSQVSAGDSHTCGIVSGTDDLKCWGWNSSGQVGDGTTTNRSVPTLIDSGTPYAFIWAGNSHTCGIVRGTGVLKCWGNNGSGRLGDGTVTNRLTPTTIDSGTTYSQISLGTDHTCGKTSANLLKCWGSNSFGQIGNSDSQRFLTPNTVSLGFIQTKVAKAAMATCAIDSEGAVYCWGNNLYGALGDGTLINREIPTRTDPTRLYSQISGGYYHFCGILRDTGALKCWGYNYYGTIGNGTTSDQSLPVQIDAGTSYSTVSAGYYHTCGIVRDTGALKCWGQNQYGKLGDGTTTNRLLPTLIDAGTSYSQVVAGYYHTCGLVSSTGAVKCWGYNSSGQLGDGTTTTRNLPTLIDAGTSYSEISSFGQHTCGIVSGTGELKCWGANADGQIGDNSTTSRTSPTLIDAGTSYSRISAGMYSTCGITTGTGALKCWGSNYDGILGDGTTTSRQIPTLIDAGTSYTQVSFKHDNGCATVTGTGALKCWGSNSYSQLGIINPKSSTPAYIRIK